MESTGQSPRKSLKQRFLSGASWVFVGKIVGAFSTLLGNVVLVRLLSPEEMGAYFLAFSIVAMVAICGQWGLNRGMVKLIASELANNHSEQVRSSIIAAFILVAFVGAVLGGLAASPLGQWVFQQGFDSVLLTSVSLYIGLWIFIKSLQGLVSETFRGFHDIRFATFFGGVVTSVLATSVYLFTWLKYGEATLIQTVAIMVASAATSLGIALGLLLPRTLNLERGAKPPFGKITRFGFPFLLTSVAIFGVREAHIWILAAVQPESSVAYYGAALRLVNLLVFPLMLVNAVLPPMIAELYSQKNFPAVARVMQQAATLTSVAAVTIFIVFLVVGEALLGILYGDIYRVAYPTFIILTAGQLVNVLTGSPGVLLIMSGHEQIVMASALIGGALAVAVTAVFAPIYGPAGAAMGFSIGVALVNIFMWQYAWMKLSIKTHGDFTMIKFLISGLRRRNGA